MNTSTFTKTARRALFVASCFALTSLFSAPATARNLNPLEQMPLDTFKLLKEAERYQIGVAEKFYIAENWKAAQGEYEKFLQLYEKSPGAPYAQLMKANCMFELRKVNTAIKEGYQSILEYWPDSREAVVAGYNIGRSYRAMGEVKAAKKAYLAMIAAHPDDVVAVMAKFELLEIARTEKDEKREPEILKDLTFTTKRTPENGQYCNEASRQLGMYQFSRFAFEDGLAAMATTWKDRELDNQATYWGWQVLWGISGDEKVRPKSDKLADSFVKYLETRLPTDVTSEQGKISLREYLLWEAQIQGYARREKEAKAAYARVFKECGEDDAALDQMATWFRNMNKREEARAVYARFKDQVRGEGQIAYTLREEQKWDLAVEHYRGLTQKDPQHASDYLWAAAECLESAGKYAEAIATFRQSDKFPGAYMRMANCNRGLKNWKEAISLYGQASSDNGSAPEAVMQIGYTYEQAGDKESAIKSFQRVCKKFPKTGQASQSHAHLQADYNITITLGGDKDE